MAHEKHDNNSGRIYARAERVSDATIHVIGLVSALIGVSVLLTYTALTRPEPAILVAAGIYSVCLLAMLGASAAYHMSPWVEWKEILRRIDQSAIYIKIAGTYTPFLILSGTGSLLAGIWGAAMAGLSLKLIAPNRLVTLGLALYLAMGWAGVAVGGELISSLTPTGFHLMVAGGIIYTLGVVFFLWEALPYHNTIWHAFVLVATGIFYAAVLIEISDVPLS